MGPRIYTLIRRNPPPILQLHLLTFHRILAGSIDNWLLRHRPAIRPQWRSRIPDRPSRLERTQARGCTGSVRATGRERPAGVWVLF